MNYPVWHLDFAGGGLLIAIIAVLHVYISHFAVGGGLFLVLTEIKGLRENNPDILAYVKRHTSFFMLMTLVLGALTGVGIWFTISLLNPAATSSLIHLFVFAWGVEWLLFLAEIISIFIYYHTFDRLSGRNHLIIGWIYFITAWLSLFVINGIIDFMLTPGAWLETGNFWDAFFNPTFWPSLFFRTFLALIIAGLFGFLTSTAIREKKLRLNMVRYCATWLLAPFIFFIMSAWWYRAALPAGLEEMVFEKIPTLKQFFNLFMICSPILILGGIMMAIRQPVWIKRSLAAVMLVTGLLYIGSFEFIREGGRKPFVINQLMYSNSILKKDIDSVKNDGILARARWVKNRTINEENRLEAGQEIFILLCQSCHSIDGPMNDINPLIKGFKPKGLASIMLTMGSIRRPYMPPFAGTKEERLVLAEYLLSISHE